MTTSKGRILEVPYLEVDTNQQGNPDMLMCPRHHILKVRYVEVTYQPGDQGMLMCPRDDIFNVRYVEVSTNQLDMVMTT